MDFLKRYASSIAGSILILFFIVSLIISSQESATFDERAHIPAAYTYIDAHDMRLNPEHPPLIKDLSGIPLQFLNVTFPYASTEWQTGINEQWTLGDLFLNCTDPSQACNNADDILFWSRLPITLVAVLLGIALFVWTKELGGALAGLLAVTLYAFDPNIIAHSHYVTTDIGIAAFIFFAFYFFIRFLKYPSAKNVFVTGIFLGLAELAKFSAVLLFPIFGLFTLIYAITKVRSTDTTPVKSRIRIIGEYGFKFLGSVLICFALIWSLYAWNTYDMPREKITILADKTLSQNNLAAQFAHALVVNTNNITILQPLAEYFLGVSMVFARVASGNTYYYFGVVSDKAVASYFPIVFILKETLPFLFLLIATTFYTLAHIKTAFIQRTTSLWRMFAQSFQNKTAQYMSVFFILFYSYISITGNLTIGFRHLFPILPFLYMLIAKTVFDYFKRYEQIPATRFIISGVIGSFALSIIAIPILAYPYYLSYFNIAAGGHKNGYIYVTDSNYDWGQDLKYLKTFIETHNRCATQQQRIGERCTLTHYPAIDAIRVDYFGGSKPAYYLKEKFIPWWDERATEPGWYAISAFFYQESRYKPNPLHKRTYEWLDAYTPVARAGDAFFIYYISEEEIRDKM